MRIEKLELDGFRNYDRFSAEFDPQVNLILGDNAQGKTNLLEAIHYIAAGASFRTRREQELIGFGREYAELYAGVYSGGREQTLRVVLFADRRRRQLYRGGVKLRTSAEFTGALTTVLFCPEDLLVLKSGASARRRLLDGAICPLRPNYVRALAEYGRLGEHKSRILKDRFDHPDLLDTLPEFNLRMAKVGAALISYRARYLQKLGQETAKFHSALSGGRETLTLQYKTVSTVSDPFAPQSELFARLREHQETHARAELDSGQCLSGPHRDDFDVLLGERSLRQYGSQGQIRTAAIALKLAEREISRQDTGEEPVLLLDDVLSELDAGRQNFILNQIQSGQVFITCCEKDRPLRTGKQFFIAGGALLDGPEE